MDRQLLPRRGVLDCHVSNHSWQAEGGSQPSKPNRQRHRAPRGLLTNRTWTGRMGQPSPQVYPLTPGVSKGTTTGDLWPRFHASFFSPRAYQYPRTFGGAAGG